MAKTKGKSKKELLTEQIAVAVGAGREVAQVAQRRANEEELPGHAGGARPDHLMCGTVPGILPHAPERTPLAHGSGTRSGRAGIGSNRALMS